MSNLITSDVSRLKLHDSSFERIVKNNNGLELVFDWAKLNHFAENNIAEPIIMGKTIMSLTGIVFEELRFFVSNGEYLVIPFPEDFSKRICTISASEIDDKDQKVRIWGHFRETSNNVFGLVEWHFGYDTCQISWSSYVTRAEWLNGKLPNDLWR